MLRPRIIPCLLVRNKGLVKTLRFADGKYVGDPINAVRIFNEKEVDEICILDITATRQHRGPDQDHISEIVSEAFMPLSYGGGITSIEQVESLFFNGVEKVVLNHAAVHKPGLIGQIADRYGRQSVTASIDHKAGWLGGSTAYSRNGEEKIGVDPVTLAKRFADAGAGEILLNSIDRDGTYEGFDLRTIEKVAGAVKLPVVACGGAGSVDDFRSAIDAGASAVAAGSLFVFQRPHNAVLISYPPREVLEKELVGK